jgi:hypothetical protein
MSTVFGKLFAAEKETFLQNTRETVHIFLFMSDLCDIFSTVIILWILLPGDVRKANFYEIFKK